MPTRLATCSCGQLAARVTGDPVRISVCHCLACQRRSGSAFAVQARFQRDAVAISGRSTQHILVGDEGGRARFHFCPDCGATVYYVNESMADTVAIPVGAFADPAFPAPWISVYESRRHGWVTLPVDMEHYP